MRRAALAVFLALAACRSGTTAAPPVPPPVEAKVAGAAASVAMGLAVVLDDPRLAEARALDRLKDFAGAFESIRAVRPEELPPDARCAWDYVEGRFALAAEMLPEAAAAFARADGAACPLSGYARLRGAQALARAGLTEQAIEKARAVPQDIASADEAKIVLAEALAARGDRAAALPLWRESLAASPRGPRWIDTSIKIANALLDGVAGAADEHAAEALDLATKVVVEAPKVAETSGATPTRTRAVAVLRRKNPALSEALSDSDRTRQAQAWLDGGEPLRAYETATSVVGSSKNGALTCKAAITRANASGKVKTAKGDAWADAVSACDNDEQLVTVLYSGAKARAGKDAKLAMSWYSRVEERFPGHRLADDARYKRALLVAQVGEEKAEERAEELLRSLPDAYPGGDMRADALFRVALGKMRRGEWSSAKEYLDRTLELAPDDRHWATAGRAEYFRARAAAALGAADEARTRYARVVEKYPLAFYMLLAYARIAAESPKVAADTLAEAARRDSGTTFPSREHAVLQSPGVVRAKRLLEVGDIDAARREVFASGALADDVDPEVVWSIGAMYNVAGSPDLGHTFSRTRLKDHLEHYPEGKWRVPWEVAYPRAFLPYVVKECAERSLPTPLAWAIMREESSFVPEAKSPANAYGLMQLIVPTAKWVASGTGLACDEAALKRPDVSIALGVKLLAKLRADHSHPALAIGAYNGGAGAVARWVAAKATHDFDLFVELIPYDETRNYVKRVLSSQAAYAYLYDRTSLSEPLGLPLGLSR